MRIRAVDSICVLYQVIRPNRGKVYQTLESIECHRCGRSLDHNPNRDAANLLFLALQALYRLIDPCTRILHLLWHSHHGQHDAQIVGSSGAQEGAYLRQEDLFRSVEGQADAAPPQKGVRFRRYIQPWNWFVASDVKGSHN